MPASCGSYSNLRGTSVPSRGNKSLSSKHYRNLKQALAPISHYSQVPNKCYRTIFRFFLHSLGIIRNPSPPPQGLLGPPPTFIIIFQVLVRSASDQYFKIYILLLSVMFSVCLFLFLFGLKNGQQESRV